MNKKLLTFLCLVLNVFFSIVIVLLNKMIYVRVGFPNITLSMIHFTITFIGLIICEKLDVFCIKDVAIKEMIPVALAFCGFVVLTNLSLEHNTIGTYQVAKMLTTPCVIIMQAIFYNKKFSTIVKLTLIPITIGVIINFYYDIRFNALGTIYATLGVLVTSLYQVWVSRKQKEFQMDPMQLLYYQAPLSAAMLFVLIPFLEPVSYILQHTWTFTDIVSAIWKELRLFWLIEFFNILMILLSSVVAFFVNLTSYWIIGYTSPLTYNMVGHSKFCLLLLGGSIVFHESLALNQAIGITLTLIGIVLYARVKMKDTESNILHSTLEEGKPLYKT